MKFCLVVFVSMIGYGTLDFFKNIIKQKYLIDIFPQRRFQRLLSSLQGIELRNMRLLLSLR